MTVRAKLVAPAVAASLGLAATVGAAPAFAADWEDATVAPGKTVVLTPVEDEKGTAPQNVTVANSEALPAGWSVVSLSGEFRVSAPVNAAEGESIVLNLKQGEKTVDEVTVTVGAGKDPASAAKKAPAAAPAQAPAPSSSSWFSGFVDRLNSFFA